MCLVICNLIMNANVGPDEMRGVVVTRRTRVMMLAIHFSFIEVCFPRVMGVKGGNVISEYKLERDLGYLKIYSVR